MQAAAVGGERFILNTATLLVLYIHNSQCATKAIICIVLVKHHPSASEERVIYTNNRYRKGYTIPYITANEHHVRKGRVIIHHKQKGLIVVWA